MRQEPYIINWDERKLRDLEMIVGYFKSYLENEQCRLELHKWSEWNGELDRNVDEIKQFGKAILLRLCNNCKIEMPNSREGQENYRTFDDIMNERKKRHTDHFGNLRWDSPCR